MDDSSSHNTGGPSGIILSRTGIVPLPAIIGSAFILLLAGLGFPFQIRAEANQSSLILGNEIFCRDFADQWQGKRLGLVINHTSLLSDGTPLTQKLLEAGGDIRALFVPEHGLKGDMEGGTGLEDDLTGQVPVFSLYGQNNRPDPSQLQEIDALIYDIQDIGTRFYTYISTLKLVLEAAAGRGIPVYVLDRPNPLGGREIEGPILESEFESFIGAIPIPIRYGLTCGELALMMKGESWVPPQVDLRVVKMHGWKRSFLWGETGLSWIPPSPNIPTPEAALFFPGLALLGGVILNPGLGSSLPYEQFGAPWMDTASLEEKLPPEALSGISFHLSIYTPEAAPGRTSSPPYMGRSCRGFRLTAREPGAVHAVKTVLYIIKIIKELHPDQIYQKPTGLNRMFGNARLTAFLRGKLDFDKLLETMEADQQAFRKKRKPYLIYS